MTDPEWITGTAGGRLTFYTNAGAEVHHVRSIPAKGGKPGKPHGLACSHCGAEERPITTHDALVAFRAKHVNCRPVWARKAAP